MAACASCAKEISGAEISYSETGELLCSHCNGNYQAQQSDKRLIGGVKSAALSSLVVALLSFLFNPLFILTIMSISSGVYALKAVNGSGVFGQNVSAQLGSSRGQVVGFAIAGIVIAGIRLLLPFLLIASVVSHSRY